MIDRWEMAEGDCAAVMASLRDECIDAIVTDPPYGTNEQDRNKVVCRGGSRLRVEAFAHDWDRELPTAWLSEAARLLRPGGAVLVFTDNKRTGDLWRAGESAGLHGLHTFHWEKPDPPPTPRPNFASAVESGVFFRKPGNVLAWNGGGWCRNIFKAPLAHKEHDGQTRYHPTEKPVSLMRWLVKLVTPPDGIVLDPFAGSGTTGVACMYESFRFVGIERESKYVSVARERISRAERGEERA